MTSEDLHGGPVYRGATTDVQTLIPMPSDLTPCGKWGSSKSPLLVWPTVATVNLDGSTIEGFATTNIEALAAISANFARLVQNPILIRATMAGVDLNPCSIAAFATTNIQAFAFKTCDCSSVCFTRSVSKHEHHKATTNNEHQFCISPHRLLHLWPASGVRLSTGRERAPPINAQASISGRTQLKHVKSHIYDACIRWEASGSKRNSSPSWAGLKGESGVGASPRSAFSWGSRAWREG
jgi:hypothetical protein